MNIDVNKIKIAQADECLSVNELVKKLDLEERQFQKLLMGDVLRHHLKVLD